MVFARRAQQRAQVGILGGLYCSLLVNTVINLMMFLGGLLAQPLPPVTVRGMVFFVLGGVCSVLLAVAAERWLWELPHTTMRSPIHCRSRGILSPFLPERCRGTTLKRQECRR